MARTLLMSVVEHSSNHEIVRILIENGADVNARVSRNTPLTVAAERGKNPEIVRILLENGADVILEDSIGRTALYNADRNEALKGTDAYNLLRQKVVENLENATEILFALARSISVEEVEQLIQEGADVNAVDNRGITPLMIAAGYNTNPEIIQILINVGANVNAVGNTDSTPLMWAATWNSNPEVLLVLLENGADATVQSNSGETALDRVERNNHLRGTDAHYLLWEKAL